jgi:sarcosine oxidase subunit gamma
MSEMHEPVDSALPSSPEPLCAAWQQAHTLINLRGQPTDGAFLQKVEQALGTPLPLQPRTTLLAGALRLVWVGPDDWFVLGPTHQAEPLLGRLSTALNTLNAAVTDVSAGYGVLRLSGSAARDTLAQGCPLDLHPRAFNAGQAAGSQFFKAQIWLWRGQTNDSFELLVRRSVQGYVRLMLARSTRACGLSWSEHA